jgi:hypothetical protein
LDRALGGITARYYQDQCGPVNEPKQMAAAYSHNFSSKTRAAAFEKA